MAYNNMFPMGYQPMNYQSMNYAQPQYNNQLNQQTQNSSGLIWVQGIEGAKSYLVAPNTTVQLWDSEEQVIYLKSADASGMPSMKILDYTIRAENSASTAVQLNKDNYISKDELKAIQAKIEAIQHDIDELKKVKENESVV